jgi:hypothetical protein
MNYLLFEIIRLLQDGQGSKFKYNSESSFKATPPIRHSEPLVGEESTKEEVGGW